MLRKALGTGSYIETVPRRGYRFAAEVREWEDAASDLIVIKEKTRTSLSYEEEVDDSVEQEATESSLETNEERQSIEAAPARALIQSTKVASRRGTLSRQQIALLVALFSVVIIGAIIFWPRGAKL